MRNLCKKLLHHTLKFRPFTRGYMPWALEMSSRYDHRYILGKFENKKKYEIKKNIFLVSAAKTQKAFSF